MTIQLTDDDKKIARAFGMSPTELAHQKQALAAQANRFAIAAVGGWKGEGIASRLSKDELAVCRATGLAPRAMLAAKERRPERAGLMEAHMELDAEHKAHYEDSQTHPGGADGPPDQELLDMAFKELKAFSLSTEKATYDRLVNGFLYVARLVNRLAPAYADRKE